MRHFLFGVFSAVLATGVGYLTSYAENRVLWRWVANKKTAWLEHIQRFLHVLAVALVIYSYIRFWLGMEHGINAFLM